MGYSAAIFTVEEALKRFDEIMTEQQMQTLKSNQGVKK